MGASRVVEAERGHWSDWGAEDMDLERGRGWGWGWDGSGRLNVRERVSVSWGWGGRWIAADEEVTGTGRNEVEVHYWRGRRR